MLILLHVSVALLGLIGSTYAIFRPSNKVFRGTYALVAATLASGTYLTIRLHSPLLSVCLSGLLYLSYSAVAIIIGHRRLAHQRTDNTD